MLLELAIFTMIIFLVGFAFYQNSKVNNKPSLGHHTPQIAKKCSNEVPICSYPKCGYTKSKLFGRPKGSFVDVEGMCCGVKFRQKDYNNTDFGAENVVLWDIENSYPPYSLRW
jgi:hypothetical protein